MARRGQRHQGEGVALGQGGQTALGRVGVGLAVVALDVDPLETGEADHRPAHRQLGVGS